MARLNLSMGELAATLLGPWVRGEEVQLGERMWSPRAAQITILEGPEVPIGGMTMGRGWPTAARTGIDVTEEVMAQARREPSGVPSGAPPSAASGAPPSAASGADAPRLGSSGADEALLADSLGLELLRRLKDGEMPLRSAWSVAAERNPQLSPSGSLQIAIRAVSSLAHASLIVLVAEGAGAGGSLDLDDLDARLADIDSWAQGESSAKLAIRRA